MNCKRLGWYNNDESPVRGSCDKAKICELAGAACGGFSQKHIPAWMGGIFITKDKGKRKDAPVKRQMQKPHIFCDFVNGVLFQGEQRLKPEMLTRLPEGTVLALEGKEGEVLSLERVRDVIFEAALPRRKRLIFRIILGEENQSFVDYGMVIREMGYEAGGYGEQLKARRQKNRKEKDLKPGDEFLSGIKKEERFVPIVNFVFYYGEKEWDGKTRLLAVCRAKQPGIFPCERGDIRTVVYIF